MAGRFNEGVSVKPKPDPAKPDSSIAGYSLIETIVALALLLTVLVPLGSFAVKMARHRLGMLKIEALSIAQNVMEKTLAAPTSYSGSQQFTLDFWMVLTEYQEREGFVIIEISVTQIGKDVPVVSLKTVRLLSPANKLDKYEFP